MSNQNIPIIGKEEKGMRVLRNRLSGSLGVWLGLQSLRTFLTNVVWIIGESLPYTKMGWVALGVVSLGFLSGAVKNRLGRSGAEQVTAAVLAGCYLATLAIPSPTLRLGLSASEIMVWIWWFSTFVSGQNALPASLMGGLSLDVAIRAALHGLDLPYSGAFIGAALLCAIFLLTTLRPTPDGSSPGWGMLALAPWLFVQMEVLTNLARIRTATGLDATGAFLLTQFSLALGLTIMRLRISGLLRALLALIGSLFLLHPSGLLWLPVAQIGASAALVGSLRKGRATHAVPLTMIGLITLFYLFYTQSTWPLLPALAAVGLAMISLIVRSTEVAHVSRRGLLLPLFLGIAAMLISQAAPPVAIRSGTPSPQRVRVMTYNIHQGLDYHAFPALEQIARVIERAAPDIISLQEVNRGWTIAGGSDTVTWLERRLPGYHLIYSPLIGDLWGTVILSRLPVLAAGSQRFVTPLPYTLGFSWATLSSPGCDLLFISAHLSSGKGLDDERARQMAQVLDFWDGRPCTIIAGDANAEPESKTIGLLMEAGFIDWLSQMTDPRAATWPSHVPVESIDYIVSTADLHAKSTRTLVTLASDHRPILADLYLAPRKLWASHSGQVSTEKMSK